MVRDGQFLIKYGLEFGLNGCILKKKQFCLIFRRFSVSVIYNLICIILAIKKKKIKYILYIINIIYKNYDAKYVYYCLNLKEEFL